MLILCICFSGKSFSVKVTTLAQKYRDNSQAKKVKTNSMIEHNKQEHFKGMDTCFNCV